LQQICTAVGHDWVRTEISGPDCSEYQQRRMKSLHLHFSLSLEKAIFTEVLRPFCFAMQSCFALQAWFFPRLRRSNHHLVACLVLSCLKN